MRKHILFATLAGLCVISLTACHDDKSANTVPPTTAENSTTMPSQQSMNSNNPNSTDTTATTTATTSPSMATGDSSTQQPVPTVAPDVVPGGDAGSSTPLTSPPASAAPTPTPSSMPDSSIQPQPSSMPDASVQPQPSSTPDASVQPQPSSSMPAPALSGSSEQSQPAH